MRIILTLLALLAVSAPALAADVVQVGAGSFAARLPEGAKGPPAETWAVPDVRPPLPATADWAGSLLWMKHSERQYPHPLAVRATPAGLQIYYPGAAISAGRIGIMGGMPGGGQDFVLGLTTADDFPDARLAAASDWFVTALFSSGQATLATSYGHGSPYVYARFKGGEPRLTFAADAKVWAGDAQAAVLGVTVQGRQYGLFAPKGSAWEGLGTKTVVCRTRGKGYLSVAVLPDGESAETLALFARHAYAFVTDTQVKWAYDETSAAVTTQFAFTTQPMEGTETATLFALYPHQWLYTNAPLLDKSYPCVRGQMKLAAGKGFSTTVAFPGVLPSLPGVGMDKEALRQAVEAEAAKPSAGVKDTYWEGKHLGRLATLAPIAELAGADAAAASMRDEIKRRLQAWFTASEGGGVKSKGLFAYDRTWGTLIGYPASYGTDTQLNDHHFHYGYFIKAAAEVARRDPAWAADKAWGGMVRVLVRDIASPDRRDPLFPLLRCFDPYAGHSWASGTAKFADGNNQESSSEAMNAWAGVILFGQATGDKALRDLGVWLFTTEMTAIHEYWFDAQRRNFPQSYEPSVVTMVWGGKGTRETWFSNKPEIVHGINWLPVTGASLYLGHYPDYIRRDYETLLREKGNDRLEDWADLVLMWLALADPSAARAQLAARPDLPVEGGNSRANLLHWTGALEALGQVDRTVTADYPLTAVFVKQGARSYVAYNMEAAKRTVRFSDGTALECPPGGFTVRGPAQTAAPK